MTGRPQGPGRQGSCCPAPRAVPALSGAAGPAPTSSAEQREARAVTWAQGAGRWPGVGPLPSQLWGRALCSWCCVVPWCRGRREAGRPGWGAYRRGAGRENVITRSSLLKVRHRLAGTEVTEGRGVTRGQAPPRVSQGERLGAPARGTGGCRHIPRRPLLPAPTSWGQGGLGDMESPRPGWG